MAGDAAIDRQEEDIERLCLRLLGARPHAGGEPDVRALAAAYKVVTDLERVGDHAAAIARSALRMQGETPLPVFIDIERMGALASEMLDGAVAALGAGDAAAARAVAEGDDGVDALYDQVFRALLTYMLDDRQAVRQATNLLFVASALERIADHATNVCEWAIFAATGQRVELND
jgi:phosphate transport system protein